jgi:hypothetical protein
MKSKRILQFALIGVLVVVIAAAGFLFFANSSETKNQDQIQSEIDTNLARLNKGQIEYAALNTESAKLAAELASAQALLGEIDFKDAAESIEYDQILFSISDKTSLQIMSLAATPPLEVKEGDTSYKVTTFTIAVQGKSPVSLFRTVQESGKYNSDVVANILDFIHSIAVSDDFDSTYIESVSISASEPMTVEDITELIEKIYGIVLKEIPTSEIEGKTETVINALIEERLTAKSPVEIQALLDDAGLDLPSALIVIKIWTYEGA